MLIVLLAASCLIGSVSSIVALVLTLMMVPVLFQRQARDLVAKQPAMVLLLAAFTALLLLFAVTQRRPMDMLFAANFISLPLASVVYVLARHRAGRRSVILVVALCLAGAAVGAAVGMYDVYVRALPRASGFFGGPNLMPRIAVTLGAISLAGTLLVRGPWRAVFLAGPVLAAIATFFSGSRGAAIAIPPMALVAAAFLLAHRPTRRLFVAASAGAVLVGAVYLLASSNLNVERFTGIGTVIAEVLQSGQAGGDSATNERLAMYNVGLEAFQRAPWIGYGWANLGNAAAETDPAFAHVAGTFFIYHNDFLDFAVAGGVVGVLCWLAILAAPLVGALLAPRDQFFAARLYCCVQLSLIYLVFGLTDLTLGYDLPTTLYAFLTAIVLGAFREAPPPLHRP